MALQNISINFPNVLTLLNAACGIISICFSLQKNFIVALIFIAIASIFDLFDGIIARRLKVYSEFGKQLDSLADVISFGVAPIVLGIMINDSLYAIIAYTTFICCAIIRLARFNVQKDKKSYYGLTVPLAAWIIMPSYFILSSSYLPVVYVISGILMVMDFRIKKILL